MWHILPVQGVVTWGIGFNFKGNNFVEALKNQISTFCICADNFKKNLLTCYGENKR
jgi:hypothetical protein